MIQATLNLDTAIRQTWDVLVVGAGPAGAMAAHQLARDGFQVLLLDRKSFPRSKVCGGCFNAYAMSILEQAGLSESVNRLGSIPTREFSLWQRTRNVTLRVPGGIAVSRKAFDAALVDAAISVGTEFLDSSQAELEEHGDDFVSVALSSGGQRGLTRARVVVLAGGLGSQFLKKSPSFRTKVSATTRIGIGGAVPNPDGWFQGGTIYMAVARNGYAGIVQVEDGSLNIAAAVDRSLVKSLGRAELAVASILRDAGLPHDQIPLNGQTGDAHDGSFGEWKGTTGLTCRTTPVAGDRVFLLGDAAGYVEPFTGEGIAWALASAVAVTPLVSAAVEQWDPRLARQWIELHRRTIHSRQQLCRAVAGTLRHPFLVSVILRLLSWSPSLATPVIRRLNAQISLP